MRMPGSSADGAKSRRNRRRGSNRGLVCVRAPLDVEDYRHVARTMDW